MTDIKELMPERLAEIRERYTAEPVPKCHICGGELTLQRAGGGTLAYACTGVTYDDEGAHYAPGRNIADDHYAQSRWVTRGGDSDVLDLLAALEAKDARIAELENERDEFRRRLKLERDILADADKCIVELQSRAVTLPQRQEPTSSGHYGEGYLVPSDGGSALNYDDVVDALSAAGIQIREPE